MDINIEDYELASINSIETIKTHSPTTLIDIEVEDDHTFFVVLPKSNKQILTHNCDGIHITYLYLGWFAKFAPWMFEKGYIAKLNTPIAMVFNDKAMTKVHKMFFNLAEYKEFEKTHDMSKYTAQYFKGLGTHTKQSIDAMLSLSGGLDNLIQVFKLDDEGKIYIDDWLNGSKADKRKEHIKEYSLDINKV